MNEIPEAHDPRRNRLQCLRSFCFAAQLGSFSRAAERVSLSQPSISLQIQALERDLKTSLFERRGPRIRLTTEGQALYDLSWPLVEAIDTLPTAFQASRSGLEAGRLHIAAGESTILYVLPDIVGEYARAYPGIELKIHNVSGREGLRLVRHDAVDLAVGSMITHPEDILYKPAYTFDPYLITCRDHPLATKDRVTLRDVAEYPLVLPPHQQTTWRVVDSVFHKHRLSYRVALEAGGWEVIKRYVELGLGISIVTGICLKGDENLCAIPFQRYFPRRTYGVVLRKGKILTRPALRFLEVFEAQARRGPTLKIHKSTSEPAFSVAAPRRGGASGASGDRRRSRIQEMDFFDSIDPDF